MPHFSHWQLKLGQTRKDGINFYSFLSCRYHIQPSGNPIQIENLNIDNLTSNIKRIRPPLTTATANPLVQATVTPKSFSHCNIPFWFLTVGLTKQEGTQTAKVRVGSGLVWLGVTSHLPRELPGSWPLYLELVSSVAAISLSLWACWACVVPLGNSWFKKCLLVRASGPSLSFGLPYTKGL